MTLFRYLWCPRCKATAKWLMDSTGLYFEKELYACKCGVAQNDMEPWETIRKIVAGLPVTPKQGIVYGFHCQGDDAPDPTESGARRPPGEKRRQLELFSLDDSAFLRLPVVKQLTGLGRTTIYEMMHKGIFPQAIKLSTRAIAWRAGEIRAWIMARQPAFNS